MRSERRRGRRPGAAAVCLAALASAAATGADGQFAGIAGADAQIATGACVVPDSIHDALGRIARRVHGEVGLSALHAESGTRISLNGDRRFPMASVSKVPMALEFLRRVEAGEVDPSETVVVGPEQFRPGHSPLAAWSGGRPVRLTIDSLFTLMLGASDNTATDVLLEMSGGPSAVTRRVRELGVTGVEVDRSEARTFADLVGLPDSIPEAELYRYQFFRMRDALPQAYRDAARVRYGSDPRDTATPEGMTALLERIHTAVGLSEASREWLLDVMAGSRSGPRRLKGLLPREATVAHKTGTMAGAINDVGVIELPAGAGHLIVSVFVNTLNASTWRRERTIAEMARLLYDHFGETYRGTALAGGTAGSGSCAA